MAAPYAQDQCPLCPNGRGNWEEVLWHLVTIHHLDGLVIRLSVEGALPGTCRNCGQVFGDLQSFANHLANTHMDVLIPTLTAISHTDKKKASWGPKIRTFLEKRLPRGSRQPKNWQPRQQKSRPAPPPQSQEESREEQKYFQLIAGTTDLQGVDTGEAVTVSDFKPIDLSLLQASQPKASGGGVDDDFWTALDGLDSMLHAKEKVDTDEGRAVCNICRKNCKTYVRLLRHCWEKHKDMLDSM